MQMYDFHGSSDCHPHNITLLCSIQRFIYSHHDCACGPHGVPVSFEPGRSNALYHMTADLSEAVLLVQFERFGVKDEFKLRLSVSAP